MILYLRQTGLRVRGRIFPALRLAACLGLLAMPFRGAADSFDTLRLYWLNQLVGTNLSGSTLTSRATTANGYWTTLNTNAGRTNLWSDAPLGSVSANVTTHFSRLQAMALAWATPGCSLQGNTSLAAAITNSLDWMCANSYTTSATEYNNWWDWEIGGLQAFNNAAVLIYPALTGAQITNYNNSVDHFCPGAQGWMTGANLTDKCKGMIIRGILGKNNGKMTSAQTNLSPVFLYVTRSDGFYRDGSFVQHTRIAYTGTYGIVLLGDLAQLVNLLNGSAWQITDPNLTNVYNWVVNSYQPLIYHGAMMDMVRGRAISRYSETESSDGSSAISDIKQIGQFAPAATGAAFTNWANAPYLPPGQFQFAGMDRVVAWRSNFCFALSLSSTRIANYESINGENLHGWFTGDGMAYLYLGTTETQFTGDFWPTVDPYHLPGTTVVTNARANSANEAATTTQNWVGGAQVAGAFGTAGMSLAAAGTTLTAKKSWFMFDNEIVCLGAGITCGGAAEVHTTVEDRRLGTSPTNKFSANGAGFAPVMGWSSNLNNAAWCALDGVAGYYFPGGATNLRAAFATNTGSWIQINNGTYVGATTNLYTDDYLTLWFNHGVQPTNATYAYVVLPNYPTNSTAAYAASPAVVILTNTATLQAASKPTLGVVAANFWNDGTNTADLITVNKKSSVITKEDTAGITVGVCDPTQTNTSSIRVTLNRAASSTLAADPGVTVLQLSPQIIFTVNVSAALGKTFQASFLYPAPTATWDAATGTTGAQDGSGTWNTAGTNWWSGSGNLTWSDTAPYIAAFGANGAAGTVTLASPHSAFALQFNPVASGAYTLAGAGPLTISNGITANATATVAAALKLAADQTWTVASNQVLSASGALSAPGPIAWSLAGAGTVNLAGTNQLSTNLTSVSFLDTQNKTTLALTGGDQTIRSVTINDGVTGTITGSGTLILNGPADFGVGGETAGAAQGLNLSGLSAFIFSAPTNGFLVGGQSSGISGGGTVFLAATSSITAGAVGVQSVVGSTTAQSSGILYLGRNTTINADILNVGLTRDNGLIQFAAGTTNPLLVLRAADGVSRANVTIGSRGSSYFSTTSGSVDLMTNVSGSSRLDALLGTLQIANEGYCTTASDLLNGNLVMGNGTLDATAISIGLKSSSTSQSLGIVNGTFTQNNGAVKVAQLTLGDKTTGNTGTLNATYNLNGGVLSAQTIQPGANAATRTLNWNNGSLANYDASTDLTIAAGLTVALNPAGTNIFNISNGRTGTVNSVLSGGGGVFENGGGTLVLTATNTYSGPTSLGAGTLMVAGALGTNSVTIAAGAALGGNGSIGGAATLQSGGILLPGTMAGSGTLTIGTLNLGDNASATTYSRFTLANGGKIAATTLNVQGTHIIQILDSTLAIGTNTLFSYTGAPGGNGFAGFKLGTVPAGIATSLRNSGASVQLVVAPLIAPGLTGTPALDSNGFRFSFSGRSGQNYHVLVSTNLGSPITNWQVLSGGNFGAGTINFTDSAPMSAQKFYRITSP
ncbi:MAG: polysaccharide lyase 8 family protein [Verrucomicrobiota bacterium]